MHEMAKGLIDISSDEVCVICKGALDDEHPLYGGAQVLVSVRRDDEDDDEYTVMGFVCSNCVADANGGG